MHVAPTANGAAWMHQMLCALRTRGHRTTAVIGGSDGTLAPKLIRDGVPFEILDLDLFSKGGFVGAARRFWNLVRLLRRTRPDVVLFHLYPSIILGRLAAWVADVPARFSMIPGTYYLESPVLGLMDVRTSHFDSKVIASCEHTRTLYATSGVPPDHVPLIYYGQDHTLFDPARSDGARVRRELGIEPDRPVVGDIAYFYPPAPAGPFTPPDLADRDLKGHDVLLRAVPHVLRRVPDALFILVGDGWGAPGAAFMADMQRLARDLGISDHVRFTGARSDIPETLLAFDVSVQCSLNENLGGSIESLLMERPLVASDVGGLPDAVKHERTGLLVPPDDPEALANAITRLLLDRSLARQLGEAGRRFALQHLTLATTVDRLEALYRRELEAVAREDGGTVRRYRRLRMIARAAYIGPWALREIVRPVSRAVREYYVAARSRVPASGHRVIQMAGAVENSEWLVQICRRLRARGHEVSAVIGWPERALARQLQESRIPYGATMLSFAQDKGRLRLMIYLVRVPGTVLRLARQFRRLRVTIVHTHIFNSIIIGRVAAWLARVPCRVSMVPGPLHLEAPFTRIIDRLTCWMDHRVVAGCEATYQLYRELGLSEPHLQCVRYGVDPERFDPRAADGARVRSELGIAKNAPVVGLVAYFYPPRTDWQTPPHIRGRGAKGHEDFLSAAAKVLTRHPDARFLVVGAGWGDAGEDYRQRLIAKVQADRLDEAIIFTGHRDDIPDVLATLDVAVQCSLTENYGGTIEALLMRRPTVATRVGGMPETVQHEKTGLLVPPSDPEALAAAICRLIEAPDEAARLAAAGRRLMLERYTIQHTVDGIEAIYRDLLDTPPGVDQRPADEPAVVAAGEAS